MSIVSLNEVSCHFGDLPALKALSFETHPGQIMGLFGHNGAGKTTSIKLILGLLKPSSGDVRVFGESPTTDNFSSRRYQIGFLPENVSFYQQQSGREVLRYFARLKKVSFNRVEELLEQLDLTFAANRKVKTYSKGMRQRLGLAQALLTKPSLLLLDEPTTGLDPVATQAFYVSLDKLKKDGCSIILCSHVLPELENHIDQALILSQGERRAFGPLSQLREEANLAHHIKFSGCFDLDTLAETLGHPISTSGDGQFEVMLAPEDKMSTLQKLLAQPGLKDLEVKAPQLQQLYQHFIGMDGNQHNSDSSTINNANEKMVNSKTGEAASKIQQGSQQ